MRKKLLNKRKLLYIGISLILCFYAVSMLLPCWYMVINSFKNMEEYALDKWGLPYKLYFFENYLSPSATQPGALFFEFTTEGVVANMGIMYFNTILITIIGVSLNTVATVCVAYACARFDFAGKKLIVALGIGALVFPDFGSGAVIYKLFNDWGWLNNATTIQKITNWLVLTPKLNPFGLMFLILYSQFTTVSKTYAEAAKIDGASELRVYVQIMIPMVKGVIGMMIVMSALSSWNDYYTSYMYLTNNPTLALGLWRLSTDSSTGGNVTMKFAFILLCITPLIIFFVAMRDVIIENAAAGGIKG